ncbi:MAG: pseudouridine synthase [Bacteroides sp.]|nr:pseudouridine synthase [Prevotella sp.]MCM1407264.1 pseudouridine synthase [Treponema brennaborense]MCM1469752.1 pseudouridine synthase [Bacteroides sp.]
MNSTLKIVYADDLYIIAEKPAGIASVPLKGSEAENAVDMLLREFPDMAAVSGKNAEEYGLVHRIDTATHGLLLAARTQEIYDDFMLQQKIGLFEKTYTAFCVHQPDAAKILGGFPPLPPSVQAVRRAAEFCGCGKDFCNAGSFLPVSVKSCFRPFGVHRAAVRPVCIENRDRTAARKKAGKTVYQTDLLSIKSCSDRIKPDEIVYRFRCRIVRGFRHQVRCHLAWCGFPVIGDILYNPACRQEAAGGMAEHKMLFFADGITFRHPRSGKIISHRLEIKEPLFPLDR